MKPLIVSLTPFVRDLRGEIDVTIPRTSFSTILAVPEQSFGSTEFDVTARNTTNTLAAIAKPRK